MFLCVAGWFMPISGEDYFMSILFVFPALSCVAGVIFYIFSWRSVDVKIGPEFIVIGRRRYARDGVSEFRGELPRKIAKRLDTHGAITQRQANEKEVVMQYGERTIPIARFRARDIEKARALIMRLQTWHEGFNRLRRRSDIETHPAAPEAAGADEFGPAPRIR
jgi:hypothetical protein